VPAAVDAQERETQLLAERLQAVLAKGGGAQYRALAESLMDDNDPIDVAAAALALVAAGRRLAGERRGAARGPGAKAEAGAALPPLPRAPGPPEKRYQSPKPYQQAKPYRTPARHAPLARKGAKYGEKPRAGGPPGPKKRPDQARPAGGRLRPR
jgi:hypothetical protein